MAKVKYPVRAAMARFIPIVNHLCNMQNYLTQANSQGVFAENDIDFLYEKLAEVRDVLRQIEELIKPFREKQGAK